MRFIPRHHIFFLMVITLCLFIGPFPLTQAQTYNQIRDLILLKEDARISLTFLMNAKPDVNLACREWAGVDISFPNLEGSKLLNQKLKLYQSLLVMSEDRSSSGITFHLKPNNTIREIGLSWIPEKKLFFLELYTTQTQTKDRNKLSADNRLKDIRFGIKEKSTRMVMGFNQKPEWELSKKTGQGIEFVLDTGAKTARERIYGPMKRLESVQVNQQKKSLNIKLEPLEQLQQIRIFWLEEDRRLVMDLVDQPAIIDKSLLEFQEGEANEITVHQETKDKKNNQMEPDPIILDEEAARGEAENIIGTEVNESSSPKIAGKIDTLEEDLISPADETLSSHIVRMKIPAAGMISRKPDTPEKSMAQPVTTPLHLVADPRFDNPLPENWVDDGFQRNLSPKEAFLYGRIEEAKEIHDFERGVSLINRFLLEFPESSIREKMVFWRGDFFYRLWRQGKSDASEMTIKNLQDAVDQYGDSEYAAPSIIKISQVSSTLGNNHEAIGLLSILINKNDPAYLPLAYLTRGKIYFKGNQPEKAVEDLKIMLREYPDSPLIGEAQFWIANYLHIKGIYDQAKARLDEIEKIDPEFYYDYPEYLFLRAQNHIYLKQYDQAREYYYKGLNLGGQPESADMLLSRIGDTYHRQSREKDAERIYRLVVDYYPKSEGAAIAKLRLADYTSNMELLEEIRQEGLSEPITDLAILEKANKQYEKGQLTDVLATLRDIILKPVQTQTRQEAKQLFYRAAEKEMIRLFRTRQYETLIQLYSQERMLLAEKISPPTLYFVAQAYHSLGEYQNAISIFLNIKPYDLDLGARGKYLMTLADAYLKEGLDRKALEHLIKHQQDKLKAEDSQELMMMLAGIYWEQGDLLKAFDIYQRVIKSKRVLSDSRIAEAYLYSGRISNRQGKHNQAAEYLNRSIALIEKDGSQSKNLSLAYIELGNSYHDRQQYTQAIKYYQQGLDLGYAQENNDYWNIRYQLAMSYLEAGEREKAEPHLREISEEAGPILQQRVQVKLGMLGLEKQLDRLSIRSEMGE